MGKAIPTIRVSSEEMETQGPGTWVEFRSRLKMKQFVALRRVAAIGQVTDPGEIEDVFRLICDTLAKMVTGWNWTDDEGEPLPAPRDNPQAFEDLEFEEIMWLINAMGEHAGKKAPPKKK